MNISAIVLEGPDGAGKSTLASQLSDAIGWRVQPGAGPPRAPGEIERRLESYLGLTGVVFDRHPAVSQHVYARIRGEAVSDEFQSLTAKFYDTDPLLIYCRSTDSSRHVVKPDEDPAHVDALERRYDLLVETYDRWAMERATVVYRIGDSVSRVLSLLRSARRLQDASDALKRDIVRRVNEANRRGDGHPARLKSLGVTLEAVVDGLVAAVPE